MRNAKSKLDPPVIAREVAQDSGRESGHYSRYTDGVGIVAASGIAMLAGLVLWLLRRPEYVFRQNAIDDAPLFSLTHKQRVFRACEIMDHVRSLNRIAIRQRQR